MLYRPEKGRIWDPTVLRVDGVFHMLTMYYEAGAPQSYALRLTSSKDGVHWQDEGNVLTGEKPVFKCGIFRLPDGRFSLNYGSTSAPSIDNDTLVYAVSDDLRHWETVGENHPDPQWYEPEGRWDHMYVLPSEQDGYVGYVVAIPKKPEDGMLGLQRSTDGLHWTPCPPPTVDFGDYDTAREIEVGACERIDGKWYLIGGICPPYEGNYGYCCYTFESDHEEGPFRPCKAVRLCGMNGVPGKLFVQTLPCVVRDYDGGEDGLLCSSTVWYELDGAENCNWVLPLRRLRKDADGLHLAWYEGNEALKGRPLPTHIGGVLYATGEVEAEDDTARRLFGVEGRTQGAVVAPTADGLYAASRVMPGYQVTDQTLLVSLAQVDLQKGAVLEGVLTPRVHPPRGKVRADCWRRSAVGFAIGDTAILMELGSKRHRRTMVGQLEGGRFTPIDLSEPGCATVVGLENEQPVSFRLLVRLGMAELYLDDDLCQTFTLPSVPEGTVALTLCNAAAKVEQLRVYEMTL